ncbi:HTH domain-containing protein [Ramlibacter sp.]|uniref:HTH domain-containing protein n=1 Tax=Ramlibacter sp. TaxID=1917967 RepID=UPI003D0A01E4
MRSVMLAVRGAGLITSTDLAIHVEVSPRSVFRYIDQLQTGGAPILGVAGAGFKWHGAHVHEGPAPAVPLVDDEAILAWARRHALETGSVLQLREILEDARTLTRGKGA